jgi:hypothetical protein
MKKKLEGTFAAGKELSIRYARKAVRRATKRDITRATWKDEWMLSARERYNNKM